MGKSEKILISIPPDFLKKVDKAAKKEIRNRSDIIREALRSYLMSNGLWDETE